MYISDFLSQHPGNATSSPNEIIPIAFIMKDFSEVHRGNKSYFNYMYHAGLVR